MSDFIPLTHRLLTVAIHNGIDWDEARPLVDYAMQRLTYLPYDNMGLDTSHIRKIADSLPSNIHSDDRLLIAVEVVTDKFLRDNDL